MITKAEPRELVRREFFNLLENKKVNLSSIQKYKGEAAGAQH